MTAAQTSGVQSRVAQVFLSYKRNVEPDQTLAREIEAGLSAAGVAVFIDHRLLVGQAWAEEIEQQVRGSDYLIVFLTAESGRSEMVRGEIEIARRAAATQASPRILPVRVAFDGPLPYPLNAYLDGIQYAVWNEPADTSRLQNELLAAIRGEGGTAAVLDKPAQIGARDAAPAYAAPLPVPGGALDVDDPWYLSRPTDEEALALMAQTGGRTVTIKGPRQMGKSSLLMRMIKAAMDQSKRVAVLDFQLVDDQTKGNADLFFRRFASSIAEQLEVPDTVCTFWDSSLTNPQNCTRYVERQVLGILGAPCALVVDETDSIFRATFSADFFAMLRSWHGLRANPMRALWKRLDIILSTSTEPDFFIDRPHESPFNVGVILSLDDFKLEQVARLNALHPKPLKDDDVGRLYALVQGHPYLTRKALYMVAGTQPTISPADLFARATDDAGPFGDHLKYYLLRLQGKPELIAALRRVIEAGRSEDETLSYRLQGAGLIRRDRGRIVPRCELYAQYFRQRLYGSA
jgi:hypothetical protein